MRVAIQLFGHLRVHQHTRNALYRNVIDYNKKYGIEFDIFIHTWNQYDSSNPASYTKYAKFSGKDLDDITPGDLSVFYGAKSVVITPQLQLTDNDKLLCKCNNISEDIMHRTQNLSYSIKVANSLRVAYEERNGIKYDAVILTRPDILFLSPLDLHHFKHRNVLSQKVMDIDIFDRTIFSSYTTVSNTYPAILLHSKHYICGIDLFSISSPFVADCVASWCDNIEKYIGLYPELAITRILKENNCEHCYIAYEKDRHWIILRNNFYYYFAKKWFLFRIFFDIVYISLLPTLLLSIKFRRIVMLNPHYLDFESRCLEKLVKYLTLRKKNTRH
jgi:hypothetical protein